MHPGRRFQPLRGEATGSQRQTPTSPHPELKSHGLSLLREGCRGVRIPLGRSGGRAPQRMRSSAYARPWAGAPCLRPAAVPVCCPDMRARCREDSHPGCLRVRVPGASVRRPLLPEGCSDGRVQRGLCLWVPATYGLGWRWTFVGWLLSCKASPGLCHPTISSSVITHFSCPQSFPASGSFQ